MSCSAARQCGQYHGWECEVSGSACMFLLPDAIECAIVYGEGPLADKTEEELEEMREERRQSYENTYRGYQSNDDDDDEIDGIFDEDDD